jgi:hypothetical protein
MEVKEGMNAAAVEVKSTRMCKRYKTTQDYLSAVLKDVFIVAE